MSQGYPGVRVVEIDILVPSFTNTQNPRLFLCAMGF